MPCRRKTVIPLAVVVLALGSSPMAHADELTAAPPASAERPSGAPRAAPLRLGAIAGVGFPRPFALEGLVSFGGIVDLGAEYGVLPDLTIDGVQTGMWSLAADARIFPFRGAFFVGLLAGRQHVRASTPVAINGIGAATEELSFDSWFLNPRAGFLWTSSAGLTLGIDGGIQIPLSPSSTSTLPLALYPSAQQAVDTLSNSLLPTVDLLRLGLIL